MYYFSLPCPAARYKSQKFKDWLMVGVTLDLKPNPLAMEVLSYLTYESVAQVSSNCLSSILSLASFPLGTVH